MEEMLILSQQLDFREVKALPLISASRWLVKKGEATRIWWKEASEAKLTFGRRVNRQSLFLFLFTDLLVVTKRKRQVFRNVFYFNLSSKRLRLAEVSLSRGPESCLGFFFGASGHLGWEVGAGLGGVVGGAVGILAVVAKLMMVHWYLPNQLL